MKYKYVVWGSKYEYNKYCYDELNHCDDCEYIENDLVSKSRLTNFFFKLHTSKKTNSIIRQPFRRKWFGKMCNFKNEGNKKYCFVFLLSTSHFYALEYGFGSYLKSKYPGSKLVCYYDDLVSSYQKNVSVDFVKKTFDLVLSFDKSDCEKYGFIYNQLVYSPLQLKPNNNPPFDVCFIGRAKNRLSVILECYDYLIKNGIKCSFNVVGVDDCNIKANYPGINFCKKISYLDNLKTIMNSRVILEVMQKGGSGYTLRTCEAIMADKKMITNNKNILNEPFFNGNMAIFEKPEDIDVSFIQKGTPHYSKHIKDSISPLMMIKKIDSILEE